MNSQRHHRRLSRSANCSSRGNGASSRRCYAVSNFPLERRESDFELRKSWKLFFNFSFFLKENPSRILDGIIDYRGRIERVDFYQGFNFFEFRVERIVNFPFTLHRSRGAISTVSWRMQRKDGREDRGYRYSMFGIHYNCFSPGTIVNSSPIFPRKTTKIPGVDNGTDLVDRKNGKFEGWKIRRKSPIREDNVELWSRAAFTLSPEPCSGPRNIEMEF